MAVRTSHHICRACGSSFTVTPAVDDERWGGVCLDPSCPSYDIDRDAERFFTPDDPGPTATWGLRMFVNALVRMGWGWRNQYEWPSDAAPVALPEGTERYHREV